MGKIIKTLSANKKSEVTALHNLSEYIDNGTLEPLHITI